MGKTNKLTHKETTTTTTTTTQDKQNTHTQNNNNNKKQHKNTINKDNFHNTNFMLKMICFAKNTKQAPGLCILDAMIYKTFQLGL